MYINGNDNSMMNKTHPALARALTCVHACLRACVHACVHACVCACMYMRCAGYHVEKWIGNAIITPGEVANALTMLGLANSNVIARWSGPGTAPSSSITVTDSVRLLE